MPYTTQQAVSAIDRYMSGGNARKTVIENTKNRGFVLEYGNQEKCVVFIYPLVHKQDNTKNYFDTRDSGAYERGVAWNYALQHGLKYFCFGVNDQVDKYKNYIFSLECEEKVVEMVSGTKDGARNGAGNQIIIPNDYVPCRKFERIKNRLGIYIAVIHRDVLWDYIEKYDNRPYMDVPGENGLEQQELILSFEDRPDEPEQGWPLMGKVKYHTGLSSAFSRNRILFGAPGTGKSHTLHNDLQTLLANGGEYERVTFHPDYSYANFVGTYKPIPTKDGISYEFVPGPFIRLYVKALQNSRERDPKPYLLIIEEINRANVAAVFGDIFQLLDRASDEKSEYPVHASEDLKKYLSKAEVLGGEPEDYQDICIPDNMFLWATMNSADQGVFPMDTAFKRRWDFTYLGINNGVKEIEGYNFKLNNGKTINWNALRMAINHRMASLKINEDKLMGPFFLSKKVLGGGNETFLEAFKNKVLMYLFEDAGKQRKSDIFRNNQKSDGDVMLYSVLCENFDKNGIDIFCDEITKSVPYIEAEASGEKDK